MKKMSKKLMAGLMIVSLLAAMLPAKGLAAENALGNVSLETKLDNDIVVYENRFADETAFNAVYNKDVDYGIHPIVNDSDGGVKFTNDGNWHNHFGDTTNYGSTQIRTYNGNSKTKAKGFWIDLDKVLETYGAGAYTFSFRVNSKAAPGLIEAVLNTAEDQTALEDIIWGSHNAAESSPYVNLGGHILCSRWDSTDANNSKLNNMTFTSTTYIPEGAKHLRFFFGGTDYDGAADGRNVGGGSTYLPVFFDDLVITKKANSYKDAALKGEGIKLKSTLTPLNGVESVTGTLIAAMYDADTNALVDVDISDELTVTAPTPVDSTLAYPDNEVKDYIIKTFFFDGFENLAPHTLAYNPHESLMPNVSFESPFTTDYRWTESGSNITSNSTEAYTGTRAASKGIASGGTYIKIGEGATATPGSASAPGSPSSLAKMLLENGKGTYKFSFMAKSRDGNANLVMHIRPYYQNFSQRDVAIGYLDIASTRWSVGPQVATPEWQKFEYEITFNPLASGETVTAGNKSGWLSYRENNYGFYLVASSLVNATDVIYIDDFKVEKVK